MQPSLLQFVSDHFLAVSGAALYLYTAAVSTQRDERPKSADDYYAWFRDFTRMTINAKPGALPTFPAPTPGQQQTK